MISFVHTLTIDGMIICLDRVNIEHLFQVKVLYIVINSDREIQTADMTLKFL